MTSLEISLMDSGKYDTIFQPVTAIFSVIGIIFTSITLIKQIKLSLINNFNNQLDMMVTMRTDIANSVIFDDNPDDYKRNYNDYKIGKSVFTIIIDEIIKKEFMRKGMYMNFNDIFCINADSYTEHERLMCIVINNIDDKISKMTHGTLSPLFHNVYTTLKMIHENNELTKYEKNNYFRMIRSHFSQQEFLLIYYHALVHNDSGERKFKKLIEDTCFFHSLIKEGIPILINSDDYPNLGYKLSAFHHLDEVQ